MYRGHVSYEATATMPRMVRLAAIKQITEWLKEESQQRSDAKQNRPAMPKRAPSRGAKGFARIK